MERGDSVKKRINLYAYVLKAEWKGETAEHSCVVNYRGEAINKREYRPQLWPVVQYANAGAAVTREL